MPDGEIGALAKTVRTTLEARPPVWGRHQPHHHKRHLGLPQLVHSAKHRPPHPAQWPTRVAPFRTKSAGVLPARRCNHRGRQHYQRSADSAATDTGATHTPEPNKTPYAPATRIPTNGAQPTSLQRDRTSQRHHDCPTTRQAPHLAPHPGQLPTTPRGEPHKGHGNNMATTDRHHRLEGIPPRGNNDGSNRPPHATPSTTNTGHAPFHNHPGHGHH